MTPRRKRRGLLWAVLGLWCFGYCAGEQCGLGGQTGAWGTLAALAAAALAVSFVRRQAAVVELPEEAPPFSPPEARPKLQLSTGRRLRANETARWLPLGETVNVQGFELSGGMIYVGSSLHYQSEPALIDPALPVRGEPPDFAGANMSYWPSYSELRPGCRYAYLDWLASGRIKPAAYIGYVFLYYYGLERRVLVDNSDLAAVRAEVQRLLSIYDGNRSFRGYASSFLAFSLASELPTMPEGVVRDEFGGILDGSPFVLQALIGWYVLHKKPLPASYAVILAGSLEDSKRSVVTKRAHGEFHDLFAFRYRERFGEGLVLDAAGRPATIHYHPASSGLLPTSDSLNSGVQVPDIGHRRRQLKPLATLWNECIDDLRRLSAKKKDVQSGERPLTAEMWEAMPPELRAQHDHPDHERWEDAIRKAPACGNGRLLSAQELGRLTGVPEHTRYSAAQLRRAAQTAGYLGFALEPEPRLAGSSKPADFPYVLWHSVHTELPDPKVYGPVSVVTTLAMSLATACGAIDATAMTEVANITSLTASLFPVDDAVRERMQMLMQMLSVNPARQTGLAKKLTEVCSTQQRTSIARVLILVAAGAGSLSHSKHQYLKKLYRDLGLPPSALDTALAELDISLEQDEPVVVTSGSPAPSGSKVRPPPPMKPAHQQLDPNALQAILKETREVAAMLATALEGEDPTVRLPSGMPSQPAETSLSIRPAEHPLTSPGDALTTLDAQYLPVVSELLGKTTWSAPDIRALAKKHCLLPNAIFETVNAWAEDALGDDLLTGEDEWTVRHHLLGKPA